MPIWSAKARLMTPLYPFFHSRLSSAPAPHYGSSAMSIVLLHGGGLSKEQLDNMPLGRSPVRLVVTNWTRALFTRFLSKR